MKNAQTAVLAKSLTPLHAVALAIGCIVGWTGFFRFGAEFLREAGPGGTLLALGAAAAAMCLVAVNYGFMAERFPVAGGEFAYADRAFGRRHSFACAWFLALAYLSCIPLNATAIGFFARTIFHETMVRGPHWEIAGFDVYLTATALSFSAIVLVATLCARGVRDTGAFQTVLVFALLGGVAVMASALALQPGAWRAADPALHPATGHGARAAGFFAVLAAAPCLFVGFDTMPQGVEEFAFPVRRVRSLMLAAIAAGAALYGALALVAAASPAPEGAEEGVHALPAFHAAHRLLGGTGVAFLSWAALAAALTGILGFLMAESRLLWSMSRERMLPGWFGRVSPTRRTPFNAILFAGAVSAAVVPFGRGALGWFVDLCSLGAAVGYGYTSAAAFKFARREGNRLVQATGAAGVAVATLFAALLLVPVPGLHCSLEPHSWACLVVWCALGALFRVLRSKGAGLG